MSHRELGSAAERVVEVSTEDDAARVRVYVGRRELPGTGAAAATARGWLLLAERAKVRGEFARAADIAKTGLDVLDENYVDPDGASIRDDTGVKVMAAAKTTDPGERASLLIGALESRLVILTWRFEDLDLRFEPPLEQG